MDFVCGILALAQNGIVGVNESFVETLFGRLKPLVTTSRL